MKMPKELKAKWVKALRSGKYKQGRGILYNPVEKSFCCLGVLEHVCLDGNVETLVEFDDVTMFNSLPTQQFYHAHNIVNPHHVVGCLIDMNDGLDDGSPKDFKSIANYIVKNVEGY